MEILRDRIASEYGIVPELGQMRVAYRESISESAEHTVTISKVVNGKVVYAKLTLRVDPILKDDEHENG